MGMRLGGALRSKYWLMMRLLMITVICGPLKSQSAENPLFASPHLLPSPYTLRAGTVVYGTGLAVGVTNFLQVGTNLLSDFYRIYNVQAKLSLVDYPEFAMAFTVGYETFNDYDIYKNNPGFQFSSWQPGGVAAVQLLPSLALFVGGNVEIASVEAPQGVETNAMVHGATIEADLSWAYNQATEMSRKKRTHSSHNALSGGVSYGLTSKLLGFGISHHWQNFQVGIHYYPNAAYYPVQPILAGGGSFQF